MYSSALFLSLCQCCCSWLIKTRITGGKAFFGFISVWLGVALGVFRYRHKAWDAGECSGACKCRQDIYVLRKSHSVFIRKKKKSRNKKNLCSFVFWFGFVKSKDDKLMLDFSMLCFRDCHKMDKMQSVWIRSRLRWLNSQEMQKSFKSKLKYLLVTCKSSYHSKNGFYI